MSAIRGVLTNAWKSILFDVRYGTNLRLKTWQRRAPAVALTSGGFLFGFLMVNKKATQCEMGVPEVKKSSLMYDRSFRPDLEISFTQRLERAASLLAPIQHHMYCWMQSRLDPHARDKWLDFTSLPRHGEEGGEDNCKKCENEELRDANVPDFLANLWVDRGFLDLKFQHRPRLPSSVKISPLEKTESFIEGVTAGMEGPDNYEKNKKIGERIDVINRGNEGEDIRTTVDPTYPHYSYPFIKQTHDAVQTLGVVKMEGLLPLNIIREVRRKMDIAPLRRSPYEKLHSDWREDVEVKGLKEGSNNGAGTWVKTRSEKTEEYVAEGSRKLQLYDTISEFECRRFDPQYILHFPYEKQRARAWKEKQAAKEANCDYIDGSVDSDMIWAKGPKPAALDKSSTRDAFSGEDGRRSVSDSAALATTEGDQDKMDNPYTRERRKNYLQAETKGNVGFKGRRWETFDELAELWLKDSDPRDENPILPNNTSSIGRTYFFIKNTHFEKVISPILTFLTPMVNTYFETNASGKVPFVSNIALSVNNSRCMSEAWHRDSATPGVTFVIPLTQIPETLGGLEFLSHSHRKREALCETLKAGVIGTELEVGDVLMYDQRGLKRARPNPAYTRTTLALFVSYNIATPPGYSIPGMYWNGLWGSMATRLHSWATRENILIRTIDRTIEYMWDRWILPVEWQGRDLAVELGYLTDGSQSMAQKASSAFKGGVESTDATHYAHGVDRATRHY
ncbi:unnamed protein product [Amoebophrya sp. A25]|nr:unnamed protein product [Amoebophrya sp. A25]|eukprot:GSA25T00012726001.1